MAEKPKPSDWEVKAVIDRKVLGEYTAKLVKILAGEMVKTRTGWECPNPDCDVIRVSTKKGYGWEETRVVRRSIVIQGGNVNG